MHADMQAQAGAAMPSAAAFAGLPANSLLALGGWRGWAVADKGSCMPTGFARAQQGGGRASACSCCSRVVSVRPPARGCLHVPSPCHVAHQPKGGPAAMAAAGQYTVRGTPAAAHNHWPSCLLAAEAEQASLEETQSAISRKNAHQRPEAKSLPGRCRRVSMYPPVKQNLFQLLTKPLL